MVIIISPQAYYLLRFFHKKQTSSKTKKASGSLNQTHSTPDKAQRPIRLIKLLIYFLKELSLIKKKDPKFLFRVAGDETCPSMHCQSITHLREMQAEKQTPAFTPEGKFHAKLHNDGTGLEMVVVRC